MKTIFCSFYKSKFLFKGIQLFSQLYSYDKQQIEELDIYPDMIIKFVVLILVQTGFKIESLLTRSQSLLLKKIAESEYLYENLLFIVLEKKKKNK